MSNVNAGMATPEHHGRDRERQDGPEYPRHGCGLLEERTTGLARAPDE
jgi:hypothetical protein